MDNKVKSTEKKMKIIVKKSKTIIKKSKKPIEPVEPVEPVEPIEPDNPVETIKSDNVDQVSLYLNSLTEQEKQTLEIASSHLGTSFNIKRSIGFLNWKSNQK
jgi:hypothetical protein